MKKNILKKFATLVITLTLIFNVVAPVSALDNSIKVQLNGEMISLDVSPVMMNNRVLVPLRALSEKLGANVQWDRQNEAITLTKDDEVVKLKLRSKNAIIIKNGVEQNLPLDAVPTVINGVTLVPVRFISQSLGKQVGWDAANKTVIIIDFTYFTDALKTQASNFYEFATNHYETINSGGLKYSVNAAFKADPSDTGQNVSGKFSADLNGKLNKDGGAIDTLIDLTGLQDLLKDSELANIEHASINILFDNNSFYVKSNLNSLLEKYNINVGDKWIKVDFTDLGIPDVKTYQDLKKMNQEQSFEQIFSAFSNLPMELDINSFKETQAWFNVLSVLVDNNHFTVASNGNSKVYTWNLKKQDLIDVVTNMEKSSGDFKNLSLKDLADMTKFVDSLVFDLNMEIGIQNNTIVSVKSLLNTQMDIPDTGHFELNFNNNYQVANPNNASFDITMPDAVNVINFKDLLPEKNQQF